MSKYRFEDIVFNITDKKKPLPEDRNHYVGLEHLDSFSLKVVRWGSDVDIIGDKLIMKKGDVLFGRRRAYQRKVGIAPFDGIFSAHGMIFRPKEKVIDPLFLPYFIMSDVFMNRSIAISVGSLSPTVNWKTLKEEVFYLPALEEQSKIVRVLMEMDTLRQKYGQAIENTDALVKSQFIEMFGSNKHNEKRWDSEPISVIAPITRKKHLDNGLKVWLLNLDMIEENTGRIIGYNMVDRTEVSSSTVGFDEGIILFSKLRPYLNKVVMTHQKGFATSELLPIAPNSERMSTRFLYEIITSKEFVADMQAKAIGTKMPRVPVDYFENYHIIVPPIALQNDFIEFAEQSDKLKFYLANAWKKAFRYSIINNTEQKMA